MDVFLFKQKTAYEMRISDWSSDVCSSDLIVLANARLLAAERGAAPLLLLDEVAAHLDRRRRAALFEEILALKAQAWLTGTDRDLFAELGGRARFFGIEDARVDRKRTRLNSSP